MNVNIYDLQANTEIECYAFALNTDITNSEVARYMEPTKGVLRRIGLRHFYFYKYGKRGQLLTTGIAYFGKKGNLILNTDTEEILLLWEEKCEEVKISLNRTKETLEKSIKKISKSKLKFRNIQI